MRSPLSCFARVAVALSVGMAACQAQAQAQTYPNKPVRALVSVAPGSASDSVARYLMDTLSRTTGKNFYVENKPGAGGNIALAIGAKSPPDGYTLQFSGLGQQIMNQFTYAQPGWESKDFDPVVLVARLPYVIAVTNDVPAKNVKELIAFAKTKPGGLNTAVTTSASRAALELFKKSSGMPIFPINYNSSNPAVVDLASGRVSAMIESLAAMLPHIESGKVRVIAITTARRSPLAPNIPTIAEQGVPEFGEFVGWTSLFVPHGTPNDIVTWLNTELNKIMSQPETRKKLAELGSETGGGTPQDLVTYVNAERDRWGPIAREAGFKAN